jgi:hypothetical protein
MSSKTSQHNANYGRGLLKARGGWTLREMLGADYDTFRSNGKSFTQRSSQDSAEDECPDRNAHKQEKK